MQTQSAQPDAAPTRRRSWIDKIVDFGEVLASVSVVLILILVCAEVFFRLFNRSTMVADELGAYLNAAIVFLGMSYTLREGGFIRIEAIYERLSGAALRAVDILCGLISLAFAAVIAWFIWLHIGYAYSMNTRSTSILQTPEYVPQSLMLIGLVMLVLQLLVLIFRPPKRVANEFL
jgi:TRAP-type C4-dicarboxylate transport system permease small subunit